MLKWMIASTAKCRCGRCRRIEDLEKKFAAMQEQLAQLGTSAVSSVWSSDTFNYLAIGNSLTVHEQCSYWWNEIGMAASDAEHDYFHIVRHCLERRFGKVTAHTFPFYTWEITEHDRDQTLGVLDKMLDDRLSLVTVQLGENVRDFTTFEEDYVSLIEHIKRKTRGRAQIIVVGDFWREDPVRSAAAKKCGVAYISLKEAHADPKYRSRIGAVVFDAEGKRHTVNHAGVAKHPGDEGMAFIAAKILKKVGK